MLSSVENWSLVEQGFSAEKRAEKQVLFFLGNGIFGMPAVLDQSEDSLFYANGFFETAPIHYGEKCYGYAQNREVMIPIGTPGRVALAVNGQVVPLNPECVSDFVQQLHFDQGVLDCSYIYTFAAGGRVRIRTKKFLSFVRTSVGGVSCEVEVLDPVEGLELLSLLGVPKISVEETGDPRLAEGFTHKVYQETCLTTQGSSATLTQTTARSQLSYALAVDHRVKGSSLTVKSENPQEGVSFSIPLEGGKVEVEKFFSIMTGPEAQKKDLLKHVSEDLSLAKKKGMPALLGEQEAYLKDFWACSDIEIKGEPSLQQGLRYNIFALLQSVGQDGQRSVSAKGLSSNGYDGHYFWDADTYVLPHYVYTQPQIAKQMLLYRASTLDLARKRAKEMSEEGALYPWRTITGEECSAYFPAGTAQYHINADIARAIKLYTQTTGDTEFLYEHGIEMLVEMARFWLSLGFFNSEKKGQFCLNSVTGPDEYTAIVNNNLYTNVMVQSQLRYTAEVLKDLVQEESSHWMRLKTELSLDEEEVAVWAQAAQKMYLPYDRKKGIHLQDDSFLQKEVWPIEDIPDSKRPVLLHYHPLVIYRHQILKQPDTILAMVLQGSEFSFADKRRNFLYYDPLTTGDSSLAPCIQTIAAQELCGYEQAEAYFSRTVRMDLDNVNNNVDHGVHIACMAGAWMAVVHGFAGFRNVEGVLSFAPCLPKTWQGLTFKMSVQGSLLGLSVTQGSVTYTLLEGEGLFFTHWKEKISLKKGQSEIVLLEPQIKAVIFDLDGVITDTAGLHYQAWQKLSDELNLSFNREVNEHLRGISRAKSLQYILTHNKTELSEEAFGEAMAQKNIYYQSFIKSIQPEDILPGVISFLDELKEKGIKIALASSSTNAISILKQLKLEERFDFKVDVKMLSCGKPDPEIFLRAAEAFGLPYRACVGVEDAASGVEAISQAGGMFSVGIGEAAHKADYPLQTTETLTLKNLSQAFEKHWKEKLAS